MPTDTKTTAARDKEILRLFAGGADVADIAEKLGMKRDLLAATISDLCSYNRSTARALLRNGGRTVVPAAASARPAPVQAPAAPRRPAPPEPEPEQFEVTAIEDPEPRYMAVPKPEQTPDPVIGRWHARYCPGCGWIGAYTLAHRFTDDCQPLQPVIITVTREVP